MKYFLVGIVSFLSVLGLASEGPAVVERDEAQGRWYISPAVGGVRLHRPTSTAPGSQVRGITPAVTFRLGYDFAESPWSLEGALMLGRTELKSDKEGLLAGFNLDALYHFDRYARFDPFLAFGVGVLGTNGKRRNFWQDGHALAATADMGLGFNYHLNDNWALRADYRYNIALQDEWMGYSSVMVGVVYGLNGGEAETEQVSNLLPLAPIEAGAQQYDEQSEHVAIVRDVTPTGSVDEMVLELHVEYTKDTAVIDPSNFAALDELVQMIRLALQFNPEVYVTLDGHADRQHGSDYDYNLRLSEDRAKSIRTYLMLNGIPGEKLQARGHSFDQPKYPVDLDNGTPQNRRTDTVIRGVDEATRERIRAALQQQVQE